MAVELEGCCRVARPTRAHRLVAIAISVWTLPLVAATLTWNGSVSGAWSTAANWTPNAVPTDFDIPVFPSGASNLSNTNDLPAGTTFHQIIFNATGYTVSGNDFSVLTSITALQNAGVVTISAPFTLVNNLSLSGDFLISGNINLQSSFLTLSQGSITVDGVISGTGDVIVNALAVKFNGNNTYSGSTNLNSPVGAIFEVNGSQPASVVKKLGGSTLGGTGTTGPVLATFGTLAPGPLIPAAAIGMLTTGNEQMSSNTLFDFQIGGTIPGTGYDQLRVLGSLDLNGATFKASSIRIVNNFVPIPGQTFVIFDNDGTDPVTPAQSDGALITPTGSPYTFRISFHGGDGNDIVLTAVRGGQPTTTTVATNKPQGATAGQPVTFTATVTSLFGTPTSGGVVFYVDGVAAFTTALSGTNTATYTTTFPSVGSHSISAGYDGDARFAASMSSPINQFVLALTPRVKADIDGDGKADVFWRHAGGGVGNFNSVWFMSSSGLSSSAALPSGPNEPGNWLPTRLGGDFDGNRKADILWIDSANNRNQIWLLDGASVIDTGILTISGGSIQAIAIDDFDGNLRSNDVFPTTPGKSIWNVGYPPLSIVGILTLETANEVFVGGGDFDFNGRLDLFGRNPTTGENRIWFSTDPPFIRSATTTVPNPDWRVAAVADFDGDGRADVFWRNVVTGDDSIWIMAGAAIMSSATMPSVPDTTWTIASFGDYDGDGKTDLFWRNTSTGYNSMWLMNGTATPLGVALPPVYDTGWMPVKP